MGRAEVLQRLWPERIPQGPHDLGGEGQARRGRRRRAGAPVPLRPSRASPTATQRARLHLGRRRRGRDALAARHARRRTACSISAPARRAAISTSPMRCATPPACRARSSSSTCRPSCAAQYQSFTEARMDRLRAAGYGGQFTPLEEGVRRYVQDYLAQARPLPYDPRPDVPAVRPGAGPCRAVRDPLVCAGLYRRPGARLAAAAPAGAASAGGGDRRCRSTISSPGRRSASCSAGGSATCCSTSRAVYLAHPAADLRGLARRHELPWRRARRRRRDPDLFCRRNSIPLLGFADRSPSACRSGSGSAASPTSSTASCGAGRRRTGCPGR